MEIGNIERVDIDNQMRSAYLDYAMSVIVARALPDARDGLKPVLHFPFTDGSAISKPGSRSWRSKRERPSCPCPRR